MTVEVALQVIAAVGGTAGLTALVERVANRRTHRARTQAEADKVRAEADRAQVDAVSTLSDVALRLLAPLQAQVQSLQADLAQSRAEIHKLGVYVEVLVVELRSAQRPVPPRPPP